MCHDDMREKIWIMRRLMTRDTGSGKENQEEGENYILFLALKGFARTKRFLPQQHRQ